MTIPINDRRIARRFALSIPLRVRVWKSAVPEQRAESRDISERGLYFATGSRFKEGEHLELFLSMPEEIVGHPPADWRCVGRVVRTHALDSSSQALGVAVQFDRYQVLQHENRSRVPRNSSGYFAGVQVHMTPVEVIRLNSETNLRYPALSRQYTPVNPCANGAGGNSCTDSRQGLPSPKSRE